MYFLMYLLSLDEMSSIRHTASCVEPHFTAFFLTIYTYSYPSIFIMNLHEWDDLQIFLFLLAHFGQCGFGLRELMMAYKYATVHMQARCVSRIIHEEQLQDDHVSVLWSSRRGRKLAKEVLRVLQRNFSFGISKIGWIQEGDNTLGASLRSRWNVIFIQVGAIKHPYRIVSTVIHEVGHQMSYRTGHLSRCDGSHCKIWASCARFVKATFMVSYYILFILH